MMLRAAADQPRLPPSRTPRHRRPPKPVHPPRWIAVTVAVALLLAPIEISLGHALGAPGDSPVSVRLVGWLRDHGGGGVVDAVENWWYRHHPPPTTVDPATVPSTTVDSRAPAPDGPGPGALPRTLPATLPGESTWIPSARRVGRAAPLYTAFFRPLPEAPSVLVGVAWMNQALVHSQLVAGTLDPKPGTGVGAPVDGGSGQVPGSVRSALLASFNSGFKIKDARGGYFIGGRLVQPLRAGAASLAIDTAGHVAVGRWGRDLGMAPGTVAVRQNLDPIVEQRAPVAGLDTNPTGAWGSPNNQFQFTWRSGLGLDAAGNLLYVAADKVTLGGLARAMAAAGIVRGMELDMHPQLVTFMSYLPGQAAGGVGTKLLPAMRPAPTRYLRPSERDFLAVSVASP